mgnify:CR=1 FL=1
MRTPEQIEALKELIINYNGKNVPDYDNIFFMIDGGSGGGGNLIPDFFYGRLERQSRKNS